MNILRTIIDYLRQHQPPLIRYLHISLITLILSQIIVSNFIEFTEAGDVSTNKIEFYGTWIHIVTGLMIIPVALIFIFIILKRNGFKYYFPYFWGEFTQLNKDINALLTV